MLGHLGLRLVDLVGGFAGAGHEELGELCAALGQLLVDRTARVGDIARHLGAHALQGLAYALAVIGEGLALGGEFVDQAPDAKLVLAVGAFERRDLAMHHGFELAGPANGARNSVVHRRDLAADGLTHRGHGLLGQPVRLGEPDGDLGHGRGHEAQLLGPPYEEGEEPEDDDGNQNGGRGGEGRRTQEAAAGGCVGDHAIGENAANDEPDDRGDQRKQERRVGRPLLKGEDQAADRRHVVIGRRGQAALRRRSGGASRPRQMLGRGRACGLGGVGRLGLFLRRAEIGRCGLFAPRLLAAGLFALGLHALALFGLEPVGEGRSPR